MTEFKGVCPDHSGILVGIEFLKDALKQMHEDTENHFNKLYASVNSLNVNGEVTKVKFGLWGWLGGLLGGGVVSLLFMFLKSKLGF